MSFIATLRAFVGMSSEDREQVRREINFFEAVEAHVAWKRRLGDYLSGRSTEQLNPEHVCQDDRCVLGKWIHGTGRNRFGEIALFRQLVDEHARFHKQAALVVQTHQAGNTAHAETLLAGDFAKQSKLTVDCLVKLHAQVEGKDA